MVVGGLAGARVATGGHAVPRYRRGARGGAGRQRRGARAVAARGRRAAPPPPGATCTPRRLSALLQGPGCTLARPGGRGGRAHGGVAGCCRGGGHFGPPRARHSSGKHRLTAQPSRRGQTPALRCPLRLGFPRSHLTVDSDRGRGLACARQRTAVAPPNGLVSGAWFMPLCFNGEPVIEPCGRCADVPLSAS
jgi:hypothetical protein